MNSCASFQETFVTGSSGPLKELGFEFITACHWACVTSRLPISKGLVMRTRRWGCSPGLVPSANRLALAGCFGVPIRNSPEAIWAYPSSSNSESIPPPPGAEDDDARQLANAISEMNRSAYKNRRAPL